MLRARLATPRRRLLAVLLLTLCAWLPALRGGHMADDHFFAFSLQELPDRGPFANLFALIDGPEEVRVFREHGILPWWADDQMRISFWRPLPSFTHWLDARLFGESAAAEHAVSLGWYLLVVLLASRVWSRFLPASGPWLAVAVLLFGLDDSHALNVGWIASRNDLVGGVFLLLAVLGVQRWREGGRPADLALLFGAFAAALASKESSVIFPALATAHVGLVDLGEGGLRARLRRHGAWCAGTWALATAWLAFYVTSGFGPNTLYYLNPTRDPGRWAGALGEAAAAHLSILCTGVPLHTLAPDPLRGLPALVALCAALTVATLGLGLRLLRHDPTNLFFVVWTVAGLAVVTTGFPDPRLLFVASMGACPLLARLGRALWEARGSWAPARPALVGLAVLHLGLGLAVVEVSLGVVGGLGASAERAEAALRADVDWERLEDAPAKVIFLNWERRETTPLATLRLVRSLPLGADVGPLLNRPGRSFAVRVDDAFRAAKVSYHLLSTLPEVEVERVDDHSLRLRAPAGDFFPTVFERLFLTTAPPSPGETRALGAFTATVEEAEAGRTTAVRFVFPEALDDPRLHFLTWKDGAWREGLPKDRRLAGLP